MTNLVFNETKKKVYVISAVRALLTVVHFKYKVYEIHGYTMMMLLPTTSKLYYE